LIRNKPFNLYKYCVIKPIKCEADHIIQKVFVEIVNNKEKAMNIKEDINSFLSVDVFPK
jgi:hypothetical protein